MHISQVTEAELKAYMASLPVDDEELSEEEIADIDRAKTEFARGETVSAADIARIVDGAEPSEAAS